MDLAATYLEALPAGASRGIDRAALAGELLAFCAAAHEAAPGLEPMLEAFVRALAARATEGKLPAMDRAVDLGLAFASSRGDARALKALDAVLVTSVGRAVARIDSSRAFADLVAQELRTRLFVGERPRIKEYSGKGPLAGWLRTTAARIALNLRRGADDRGHEALRSNIRAMASEPEVAVLRAKYREDFEAALRVALETLPSKEKAILCLNVRDGMSSEKIATLYRVSRATAKRMLVRARQMLLEGTEKELRSRLMLTTGEFESIARVIHEDLEVSVLRLLKSDG